MEARILLSADALPCATTPAPDDPYASRETMSGNDAGTGSTPLINYDPADQLGDIFDGTPDAAPATQPEDSSGDADEGTGGTEQSQGGTATQPNGDLAAPPVSKEGSPSQTDVSNPASEQLTDTLRAANGPPADSPYATPQSLLGLMGGPGPQHTILGAFTPDSDEVTEIVIQGLGQGTSYDWIEVTGAATLNGTLKILFSPSGGYTPSLGDTFEVMTWNSVTGEFANWLNTSDIPGHSDWSFKPIITGDSTTPGHLVLQIVQTPTLAIGADVAINAGLDRLSDVGDLLDGFGEFAENIPFIGSQLGNLADSGSAITDVVKDQLSGLLSTLPRVSQVTTAIQDWEGTNVDGFGITVRGVLAHYGALSTDPMWWEITLELTPNALNQALQDIAGGIFDAAFTGTPSVTVNTTLTLDFAFGYDGQFFVEVDAVTAAASVNASGIGGFGFNFDTPLGMQGLSGSGGTVNLEASVTATPDAGVLTGGRITSATLTSIATGGIDVGDAFNLDEAGTLDAAFPLTGTLNFLGFTLAGTYTLRVQDSNLMDADAPDVDLEVASTLTVNGQTLSGTFTLKNTGTETIIAASGVTFNLGAGSDRVFSIQNGSGTFVLLGTDLAGTLTMDFNLGPAIPNLTLSLTGLNLRLNTSAGAVPTIDGVAVDLPAGPYFRVAGNGSIGITNLSASLSGDFVFEPRDGDSNPANGYEEVAVGVANLSFNFSDNATNPLLSVSDGTGAFVFRNTGVVGSLTVQVGLAISELSLNGVFGVVLNNTATSYNQSVDVNGTSVTINVLGGPYLRVTAKGNITDGNPANDHATLEVLGITLTGDFSFESKMTTGGSRVVTVVASSVSLDLGSVANDLISITDGNGVFIITDDGVAGTATATVSIGISSLSLSGTFTVAINTTPAPVTETVNLGGPDIPISLPIPGPYLQVNGSPATLTVLGVSMTGNFSFEQRESADGTQLVTVLADSVNFDFGTNIVTLTNGSGFFLITDGGIAGHGEITAAVNAFGGSFSHTFEWSFNNTTAPISQSVDWEATPMPLNLPAGPFNTIDSGGEPITIGVTIGSYTQSISGRFILTLMDPNNPTIALQVTTSGGINGASHSTAVLNPPGDDNAVRITTTLLGTAGDYNGTVYRFVDDPTITNTTATAQWDDDNNVLTVRVNAANTTGNAVVAAINAAGSPFSASLSTPDNGVSGNNGVGTITWYAATVAVSPNLPLSKTTSGGVNGSANSTATLNPSGDDNAIRIATTSNVDAADWNGTELRITDDPTITDTSAYGTWDSANKILTVRVNAGQTLASTVIVAINSAGSPFTATLATPDNGASGNTGGGAIHWFEARMSIGPLGLKVTNGSGAFVIFQSGVAGEVNVQSASLSGAGVLNVNATNLKLRFNTTGDDVGNPDAVVVSGTSLQFAGPYYHQYLAVSGAAEITGLAGAIALGGNFAFERAQIDTNSDAVLEDVFKVGASEVHFELKAGSVSVMSFHNGTGAFIISPNGIAGKASLQFEVGIINVSGTLELEVNTTSSSIVDAVVPLPGGDTTLNLANTNYVLVCVENGYLHLGSIAIPLPAFQILITGGMVVIEPKGGGPDYLTVDSLGNIDTSLSFSDFAAPGPFEFVSMLRQALIWIDTFRDASVFDIEIPFTGGKTLGDAFDWTQLFLDRIYSHMVSVELQSRSMTSATVNSDAPGAPLTGATFKLRLNNETPYTLTMNDNIGSGTSRDGTELVTLFTNAINSAPTPAGLDPLNSRIRARINRNDQLVIELVEAEIAKGTSLNLITATTAINNLGFGPGDSDENTVDQVGVLTERYDTEDFLEELADLLIDDDVTNDNGGVDYDPARQVYTYTVNKALSYGTQDLFGTPTLPFDFDLALGPVADASLSGALDFLATVGFDFTLGFDLGAREVPRILTSSLVPVPANGRITQDATFRVYLNDELTPLTVTLPASMTSLNDSIEDLADNLNTRFAATMYNGPLTNNVATPLNQLIVAQKAGTGLAISAIHEIDTDGNGVPDPGKDLNGDGDTDDWLGIINRLTLTSAKNDPFATEMGFGNEVVDLNGIDDGPADQIFMSISNSTAKGLFIDNVSFTGSLEITTPTPITGSLRFGFVEITTSGGSFGTVGYDGTTPAPLTATLSLQDQTTGETRFYLADLFNGTSSNNIGNMVNGPTFTGSVLARLDNISVGGLGFNFPLGADPEVSVWVPDINDLDYNPDPYNGANTGIFLKYPELGGLQDFGSLNFTQIIRALNLIADQLSQLSAFSFLDEPLPFVNMSVNDMLDYAQKFADLLDGLAGGGSQSSLQKTIDELEDQIEELFNLDPDVLTLSIDDGGLSGLSGATTGGNSSSTQSSFTFNLPGDNNDIRVRTTNLATSANFNGTLIRFVADPSITNTAAIASWDAANKVITIRINSGHTTASAVESAVDGLADWDADLVTPDNNSSGNTGAGVITTSAFVATGGVNNTTLPSITLMPGGDNNNFKLTLKAAHLATAANYNGSAVRIVGDSTVTGNNAQVNWNSDSKTLTIKINPGVTTANTIITAITTAAGIPWNAALAPPDNGAGTNSGNGPITTTALKFSLAYTTAYADSLPFQLDLNELVNQLVGESNAAVRALLDVATTLVQIRGEGRLTISASAALTLDFGLDLTNPSSVKPFLYDTTGVELKAKVLGTDLEIEASLGGVFGIFIHDGRLTLDADGNPDTDAGDGDQGAVFRLGLLNNNGDNRHYFNESFFDSENLDLTLQGGARAQLPIFAPFDGNPLSGDDDTNGDGYPDNYLVIDVPDVVRLFQNEEVSTRANENSNLWKTVVFGGTNNDFIIKSTSFSNYEIIFLNTASGGAANATFNVGTNTLTVSIDSGDTTAYSALTAIQNATNAGGAFATSTLTLDDDGAPLTSGNTGDGKLNKLLLVTPDFGSLFDDLDLCEVFASQIGTILDGLDALLGSIEDGLRDIVSSIELPLVGDGMAGAANFIQQFRSGLLQQLRDEVGAAGGNGLVAIENAVKKALWNSIGPGGLDLLVDVQTGEALDLEEGYSQLDVTLDCDEGLVVNVRLKKEVALLDTTQNPIDFQIGVPGFGLEVDGNVVLSVGFDLKFGFGFNAEDGFFFDSSSPASDPELILEFKAEIPGLHAAGELLFLQLDVTDDADDPSIFRGFFEVDLKDPDNDGKLTFAEITSSGTQFGDIIHAVLGAEAHVNLDLIASFGGNTAFPRVLASFHLDWMFDTDSGAGDPQIAITDIYLDLGTFLSDFLGPVLKEIRKVTEPVQPIIDVVTARIPVLSDLAGQDITLLTLAEVFGLLEPSTVDFIEDVIGVVELINSLEGLGEGTVLIPFGAFSLIEDANGERKGIAALQNVAAKTMDEVANAIAHADDPGTSSSYQSAAAGFVSDAGSLNNFSIPIWDNPSELFNLFIGEPVRLVEWRMPTFKFEFTYTQKIPIYPPLYAQFGGRIGATIDIGFGYDTFGIQKFIASEDKNVLDILDGFYVIDFDENGNERPELTLQGEVFAGASISLLIVEAGVNGGIGLSVEFDLNDVNDDGKVRVSEIVANAQQSPLCIFDIHGEVFLFLEAFLKIDLFFFSIDKTWRFAEITLVEFDITCPEPILASNSAGDKYETGDGDLYLNIGSRATFREEIDTNDNAERFIVKHISGSAGSEVIEIQWGNFREEFTINGRVIVEDAGQGDDYIDLRGILSGSEVHGGVGNDTIFLSDGANSEAWGDEGNDTITASSAPTATGVVLHGGDGNDLLVPGTKAITIYGDAGNDTITGTDEADELYGDDGTGTSADGDDVIDGKDGDDLIRGGKGNDIIEGGADNDWIRGDDGADVIRGGRGDDVLDGGGGDDFLYGSSGNDLLLGGAGSDWANGHGGIDLLIGDHEDTITINNLTISEANLAGIRAAIAAIPTAGITVKDISGYLSANTGHDLLIGGGNVDALFGGPGNDFLYGGNFMNTGETEVIEEDHNDFFDGGPGNDTIFGDDAMGRTGERNTGIAINSSIWFDTNGNNLRDSDEKGFAGVTVSLYRQSDPGTVIATEETDIDGLFEFNGLDKGTYFLRFSKPSGLSFVTPNAGGATFADEAENDSDMVDFDSDSDIDAADRTNPFEVDYDETESAVGAGYTGPAQVSIDDQSVIETQGGQITVTFTVTLSHFQPWPVEIEYRTDNGTATWQSGDYEAVGGSVGQPNPVLTFAPGELSRTITVVVYGDTTYEAHEQFQLNIVRKEQMDPGGAVTLAGDSQALVTIMNDDPIPSISIRDFQQVGVDHDNDPLTAPIYDEDMPAVFVVTLSNPSAFPITVQWRTDPALTFQALDPENAATPSGFPGADFVMNSGTLTFPAGVTNRQITVTIIDDSLDEMHEQFFVDLFNPTYATIADGRAFGIIADDDAPVSVSIVPDVPVPGQPFTTQVAEGSSGLTEVSFWVKLSGESGKIITVTWATSPGTAFEAVYSGGTDSVDYIGAPTTDTPEEEAILIFYPSSNPLDWMKKITVTIRGDPDFEGTVDPDTVPPGLRVETFFVNILSADNANIAATPATESNHATVKIVDDDSTVTTDAGPWSVYFDSPTYTVDEPDGGPTTIDIIIRRTPGSSEPIAVFYTTNGTATAGSDYEAVFRRVIYFEGDDLEETISITILPDLVPTVEGDETVHLWLRNPTGGPVRASPDHAILTIRDSDTPVIHILPAPSADTEGSGGGANARAFLVYLLDQDGNFIDAPTGGISFNWRTVDMTARSSPPLTKDFNAVTAGSDTIPGGTWFTYIYVDVVQDDTPELSETFAVRLTSAPAAILEPENGTAIATIYDDDKTPIRVKVFYDNNGNGFKDLSEKSIQDVDVEFTYFDSGSPVTAPVTYLFDGILQDYFYEADVLLGQVSMAVDGATVTSPYKNLSLIIPFIGSGNYETTTDNETQTIRFEGIVGLPAFADVGYDSTTTFSAPTGAEDVGRGGTDDVIFGGPGDDQIDAGAGDDHIIGGHWMTATDQFAPVNLTKYNAVVTATTDPDNPEEPANDPPLHNVYDQGPIFGIDTASPDAGINANGRISGQIWIDANNNGRQDLTESLLMELVFVNLYDCDGNPINTVVTTDGTYEFTGLFLKDDGTFSEYVVEFDLPHDRAFTAYVIGPPEDVDTDVIVGGRTQMISIRLASAGGPESVADVDAGVKDSDVTPLRFSGGFRFSEASYSVSENVKNGKVTVSVKRTNGYTQRVVVVRAEDGTATAGVNYKSISAVLFFDIGETEKTVDIPILDTDTLDICIDPLTFELVLRDATGRPYDRAPVYIGGESWGDITDDDTIDGNLDWDIILGDSGNIPADAVIQDLVANPPINNITIGGGPGKDLIRGGDGNDWIHGQLFNDIIFGGVSDDEIFAGLGDDIIYAEWDNDNIDGDYGDDTIISFRDVPWIELETNPPLSNTSELRHKMSESAAPLSTFTLANIETAKIFGGPRSATYKFISWDGAAYVSGAEGNDTLLVENDTDMLLKDASLLEGVFNLMVHGFFKDASLTLPAGSVYHLGSLENVRLTGGVSDNTLDASGYSRRVTFVGGAGNDTLIGGSNNDTFLFDADSALGADTVTGNGGADTLSFVGTSMSQPIMLDMALHVPQVVAGPNLSLILTDEIENATGGDGDDVLKGNAKSNVLLGGKGNDTLQGRGGNETYAFDTDDPWGTETIIEDAGQGNDTLDFSGTTGLSINVNISITGFQVVNANLSLIVQDSGGGEAEIENIIGGALHDTIRGNRFNNNLFGGPGNDILDGKSGDDTLDGGTGDDDLNGGAGNDSITVIHNTNFTLTDTSLARATGEVDTLDNIELARLIGGTLPNTFTLTGWSGGAIINGGAHALDRFVMAADVDFMLSDLGPNDVRITLSTGQTIDLINVEFATLTGGPSDNELNASALTLDALLFPRIHLTLIGGAGNDKIRGSLGNDIIRGGIGDDILTGNAGNDLIDGGAGNDTLEETRDASLFVVTDTSLLTDLTTAVGDEELDALFNLEIAILAGGPGANSFDVTGWTANTITVDGAGGTDTVNVQVPLPALPAPAGGTVTLTTTSVSFTGSTAVINLNSIEQAIITGTDRDETLDASGFLGATLLRGMGGDDVLKSAQGGFAQLLDGGDGDDRFIFVQNGILENTFLIAGDGTDTLDFSAFTSGITVDLSITGAPQLVLAGDLSLYLVFEDVENLIGGSGGDTLTGNSLNNTFTGGAGADNINGLGGTNTIIETADTNWTLTNLSLTDGGGNVDILTNVQRATLTGGPSGNSIDASAFTGSATLVGEGGDDILIGGSGSDTLIGGAGNDLMRGNAGNDTYLFDVDNALGEDTVDELAGGGSDFLDFRETTTVGVTVDLSLTSQQTVHATNLKLTLTDAAGIEFLAGGDQADVLIGNANMNFFLGGRGNDIIRGGGGADTVFEFADGDFTLVSTSPTTATLTIVTASGIEQDQWTDIESANLTGGAGNNIMDASQFLGSVVLIGGDGNDTLIGGYGNDNLFGGNGDDNLVGGAGADTLRGDAGNDTLNGAGAFDTTLGSDGNDTLIGGAGNDIYVFDLSEIAGAAVPQGSDTIIELFGGGAHDIIVGIGLAGIDIDLLSGAPQDYDDSLGNLVLTLTLSAGQIEHSFP